MVAFRMMIDCGTWSNTTEKVGEYIDTLKEDMGEVDLLVVTHEHKDHVSVFEKCADKFRDFTIKNIWMAWTENEKDALASQWIRDFGEKKKALAVATNRINKALKDPDVIAQFSNEYGVERITAARQYFAGAMDSFADLQFAATAEGEYKGGLRGMEIVKKELSKDNIRFCKPGEIISGLEGAEGLKFYVLGPPQEWEAVRKESGGKGESYLHNDFARSDAFASAVLGHNAVGSTDILPFDTHYVAEAQDTSVESLRTAYEQQQWRRIDHDWLNSAGSLALRVNSMTNNLSLALAIEFENGKVMLFPGDAEYGSWESWHRVPWTQQCRDAKKGVTEDLLNRTVFYKVAHHLSHNGTAQRLGMEMMTSDDLTAMASLDYDSISPGWTRTMPNHFLLKELLTRTKGRLIVMNDDKLLYNKKTGQTLADEIVKVKSTMGIQEQKSFADAYVDDPHFHQYTVKISERKPE